MFLFWPCVGLYCSEYTGLPEMKHVGPQTQRAAAMEASKQAGCTETALDFTQRKNTRPLWKKHNELSLA